MGRPAFLVLIPYPFSDVTQQKKRPELMLTEPDSFGDLIGLAVTSKGHHDASLALTQKDMQSGSLPKASWIRTDKVFTVNRSLIVKDVGEINNALFLRARQSLCAKIGCNNSIHSGNIQGESQ